MASNSSDSSNPPLGRHTYRNESALTATRKLKVLAYDSDGLESDDDTLLALSSLAKMESTCQNELDLPQQQKPMDFSAAIFDSSADSIDIVHQAIDAVEDALVRCPKYARREALTELLMHAKLEQAKKASALTSGWLQNANVWAEMLMQVQELGRNYPKDPQVHELVYLVQECLTRNEKRQGREDNTSSYGYRDGRQLADREHVGEDEMLQPEMDEENELCGRLGEVAVDGNSEDYDENYLNYRMTEDNLQPGSNQSEADSGDGHNVKHGKVKANAVETAVEDGAKRLRPVAATKLRDLVPILTGNVILKGVEVPQLPRGRDGWSSSDSDHRNSTLSSAVPANSVSRTSRQKFHFPEKELLEFLENEGDNPGATPSPGPIRRFSHNSNITCTVPLRRKSFIMKRTSLKSSNVTGISAVVISASKKASEVGKASVGAPCATKSDKQRMAARRKSTSACHATTPSSTSTRRNSRSFSATTHQILALHSKRKPVPLTNNCTTGSPRTTPSPSSPGPASQMVVRVRARDGVPQLLIAKKPVRCVVWHWHDRCIRVPFMNAANMMELGPAQHGIMLRQLRYVKSMMHDYPWAKAHLRSLLSRYTAKEVTKEELYPQLNALGQQVQREISTRAKHHRTLTARKQRLTITLTLATNMVNDTLVTKFGRRGRPHASRLLYDPTTPLELRWRRKHGERSVEVLLVDAIQVIEGPDNLIARDGVASFKRGNKKAAAAVAVDPESCLSLVTPTRSLDLQVASSLHREWLANAVRDIVSFAQQFKAAKANTANVSDSSSSSDTRPSPTALPRRSQHSPSSQNVLLF